MEQADGTRTTPSRKESGLLRLERHDASRPTAPVGIATVLWWYLRVGMAHGTRRCSLLQRLSLCTDVTLAIGGVRSSYSDNHHELPCTCNFPQRYLDWTYSLERRSKPVRLFTVETVCRSEEVLRQRRVPRLGRLDGHRREAWCWAAHSLRIQGRLNRKHENDRKKKGILVADSWSYAAAFAMDLADAVVPMVTVQWCGNFFMRRQNSDRNGSVNRRGINDRIRQQPTTSERIKAAPPLPPSATREVGIPRQWTPGWTSAVGRGVVVVLEHRQQSTGSICLFAIVHLFAALYA